MINTYMYLIYFAVLVFWMQPKSDVLSKNVFIRIELWIEEIQKLESVSRPGF